MQRPLAPALALIIAACGGAAPTTDQACTPTGANKATYVVDSLTVPTNQMQFAADLDGNAMPDNQLGRILSFLVQSGLPPQNGVDDALNMGQITMLFDEVSADGSFQSDTCASSSAYVGVSSTMMKPVAGQTFTVDSTQATTRFTGPITAGSFTSQSQLHMQTPLKISLAFPLLAGTDPIPIILTGADAKYQRDAAGALSGGEIHGVIRNDDLQNTLIPGIARLLTQKVQRMLGQASTNMQILMLFDTGGAQDKSCPQDPANKNKSPCKDPDGTCAKAGDGVISTCEVSTSFLQFVLVPDLQMFDDKGNWAPVAGGGNPDSLSVGLGFTAVDAKF